MDPYDIARIFVSMEYDLIASMKRNLVRHLAEEAKEGFEWEQWQQRKLEGLKQYRELLDKYGQMADKETESLLRDSFRQGGKNVDSAVSRLWKKPQPFFIAERMLTKPITLVDGTDDSFFKVNEKRVNALIDAVKHCLQKGRHAMLRQADDVYRQESQVLFLKELLELNKTAILLT